MAKHNRAIDFENLKNSDIQILDEDEQTENIGFKSLLWIQIGNINKAITLNRPDLFSKAVAVLEINLNYFLERDKEDYGKKLTELINKYDELKKRIPAKERLIGEAQLNAQFSEEKYLLLMYFMGKKGYLDG